MITVHPTAIVDPKAVLGEGTEIGAYSVIGPHVKLGQRTKVGPHVVIEGYSTFGDDNVIFQFASLGAAPQDLKFKGEPSELIIGNKNIIREYVTLQPGTAHGKMKSVVGNGNLFMAGSHLGHDTEVGNGNVFANYCSLAGHVTVGDKVTVGGMAGVHQFARLGDLCILGAGSMVAQDIPPFCMAQGDRAELIGLNKIGLQRSGISAQEISHLKSLYRAVFFSDGSFATRLEQATAACGDFEVGARFLSFLRTSSSRGVARPRLKSRNSDDES